MLKSDLAKFGLLSAALMSMLAFVAVIWEKEAVKAVIDPLVEKACHDEVKTRAPLGHRAIMTYAYHEEGSQLGIVSGSLEAQYAPKQWTQVDWTCRVNPIDRQIARVELAPASGGHRMKAAASVFQ